MRRRGLAVILLPLIVLSCDDRAETAAPPPAERRGFDTGTPPVRSPTRDVDWTQSAGVFIGVQTFHDDSDLTVPYAADDAVDLAWLFTHEAKLLPPVRTALLLAGVPSKEESRRNLETMRREVKLRQDGRHGFAPRECLNEQTIFSVIREQARSVGPNGILIVSFATHGLSSEGEHRLLTADATSSTPSGVVLARIVEAITEEGPQRLLLLIDACRNKPRDGTLLLGSPTWQPRLPATILEDVELRLSYAALVSASPGTTALAGHGNGYFTRAVLDGLRCNASSQPEGWVTLSNLATYVSERVPVLSGEQQQPESRIGSLGPLRLIQCLPPQPPCTIIEPKNGDVVESTGFVRVQVTQPELFAIVFVCAAANNYCYTQNPEAVPRRTQSGETMELAVHYGGVGRFTVHAACTADPHFLLGIRELQVIPGSEHANRLVHWCGPVEVKRKR
jgi:hypothetical protein